MMSILQALSFLVVILFFVSVIALGIYVYLNTLSSFKWYRRWHGGRWECWYVDPCKSMIWHDIKKGEQGYPNRPPCCFGTPIIQFPPSPPIKPLKSLDFSRLFGFLHTIEPYGVL